jgi:hypothetical protein
MAMEYITQISSLFSNETRLLLILLFFTSLLVVYSVFIFYFYKFLAKRDLVNFNLNKYNNYENQGLVRIFAVIFYVVEYLILLPILTFFWFVVLSILVLLLAEGISISVVLQISASLVAAVRITSYVSQNLSQDLAKMLPLTLIGIAITKPSFFHITSLISRFEEIPLLIQSIPYYLIFIIIIELVMRVLTSIEKAFKQPNPLE